MSSKMWTKVIVMVNDGGYGGIENVEQCTVAPTDSSCWHSVYADGKIDCKGIDY